MSRFFWAGLMAVIFMSAPPALAAKRLALVVGVNKYEKVKKLPVAELDAKRIAEVLKGLDFEVVPLADPTKGEIIAAWSVLLEQITSEKDVVLLYFAGHGIELRGGNYLIPREVAFDPDPAKVIAGSVSFQDLLGMLAAKQTTIDATAVFILDACRENPFKETTKASEIGLAPLSKLPKSVFVMYSAGIGQFALEGKPPNSVYTTQLVRILEQQKDEEWALADLAQKLRHKVYLDALTYTYYDSAQQKYLPRFQTPAYYDQFRERLSLFGNRVDKVKLEPVGSTLIDESLTRALGQGDILRECEQCPELVVVGPGSYAMGSPATDRMRDETEEKDGKPLPVTIAKPFAIGRFEITNGEWNVCVEETAKNSVKGGCQGTRASAGEPGFARQPVSRITWDDAQSYVTWLNWATRQKTPVYRLPTEAEWEFAARAGTTAAFSFGDDPSELCAHANGADPSIGSVFWINLACPESDGFGRSAAQVGSFKPNPWGLFDVHGNLAEWVQDCWQESYERTPADGAAYDAQVCDRRVIRGGSWRSQPAALRTSARNAAPPSLARMTIGFRVVRSIH